MLGPCLVVAALLGFGLRAVLGRFASPDRAAEAVACEVARGRRVAAALGLGLVAALANPLGVRQHLAFSTSAGEGAIFAVLDDWTPFDPLAWDRYGFAVDILEWLVADLVLTLFVVAVLAGALRFLRRPTPQAQLEARGPTRSPHVRGSGKPPAQPCGTRQMRRMRTVPITG